MDKKIKFLSDFKPYHDRHVQVMRMVMPGMDDYIKTAESFLRKAVKCCDFCMCMPIEYFEKALKENEIKEMFETGHGATIGGKSTRREAMQQLYSLDSTRYSIKEMPKYGLLVGKNRCADLINDPDVFYHYGAVMITFKKERVIHRTTLTVGSSLQFKESLLKTPTFADDPKFISIKGWPKSPALTHDRVFNGLSFFAQHLVGQKKLSPDLPNKMAELSEWFPGFENFEIQIFGKLTFSDDVEKIEYLPFSEDDEKRIQRLKPRMAKYGFDCRYVFEPEEHAPFEKTATLTSEFGAEVEYGWFEKDSDIFFVLKTGNNGSLRGYMDKYMRIAANTSEKFGVNAIIANNPENPDDNYSRSKMDIDLKFVSKIAAERNIKNYKVYYMGYSNSAQVAACNAHNYPEISRLLLLNTVCHNEDKIFEGFNKFHGEKLFVVHGTEDDFLPTIQSIAVNSSFKNIKFTPIEDADHQFIGMMDEFIGVSEIMFE